MNIEEATMKALSGKLEESKVGYQAGICPKCGADIQDYEEVEWFDDSIGYPFHCSNCGADGMEYYNLTFDEIVLNDDFGKTEEDKESKE